MALDRPPLSADDLCEQLRAEECLARLDLFEDLAEISETEAVAVLRQRQAELYRRAVGVFPHQRQQLKSALRGLVDGGSGQSVANLIAMLADEHQQNGSVAAEGPSSGSMVCGETSIG